MKRSLVIALLVIALLGLPLSVYGVWLSQQPGVHLYAPLVIVLGGFAFIGGVGYAIAKSGKKMEIGMILGGLLLAAYGISQLKPVFSGKVGGFVVLGGIPLPLVLVMPIFIAVGAGLVAVASLALFANEKRKTR